MDFLHSTFYFNDTLKCSICDHKVCFQHRTDQCLKCESFSHISRRKLRRISHLYSLYAELVPPLTEEGSKMSYYIFYINCSCCLLPIVKIECAYCVGCCRVFHYNYLFTYGVIPGPQPAVPVPLNFHCHVCRFLTLPIYQN